MMDAMGDGQLKQLNMSKTMEELTVKVTIDTLQEIPDLGMATVKTQEHPKATVQEKLGALEEALKPT